MRWQIVRLLPSVLALAVAGCAAWDADIDTRRYPGPPQTLTEAEVQRLTARAQELRLQGAAIRNKLAGQPQRSERMRDYQSLHNLQKELGPIERALAASGRLVADAATVPPVRPQALLSGDLYLQAN